MKLQKHSTNNINTVNTSTRYQNTHTIVTTPIHYKTS